jgi:hypothetical protein
MSSHRYLPVFGHQADVVFVQPDSSSPSSSPIRRFSGSAVSTPAATPSSPASNHAFYFSFPSTLTQEQQIMAPSANYFPAVGSRAGAHHSRSASTSVVDTKWSYSSSRRCWWPNGVNGDQLRESRGASTRSDAGRLYHTLQRTSLTCCAVDATKALISGGKKDADDGEGTYPLSLFPPFFFFFLIRFLSKAFLS